MTGGLQNHFEVGYRLAIEVAYDAGDDDYLAALVAAALLDRAGIVSMYCVGTAVRTAGRRGQKDG